MHSFEMFKSLNYKSPPGQKKTRERNSMIFQNDRKEKDVQAFTIMNLVSEGFQNNVQLIKILQIVH